jgi:hypothetical protein
MADENTAAVEPEGQPESGPETTTVTGTEGTTATGTIERTPENEGVFDPGEFKRLTDSLPPELQHQARALQKGLQGAYTKKFQEVAENRKKIEAYDAFSKDPATALQQMAQQMGYTLSRRDAQQMADNQSQNWEPQTWDEVMTKAEERATAKMMQQFAPLLGELQNIKRTSIESQLSEIDPSWQAYEEKMMGNLKQHPTLAADPAMLYRLSVPPEILESRATQKALARMQAKTESGKVSGPSTTNKTNDGLIPDKSMSFSEAVAAAKKKLAQDGLTQT